MDMEPSAQKKQRIAARSAISLEPFYLPSNLSTEELVALRDRLKQRLARLEEALERRGRGVVTNKPCEHVFAFCSRLGPRDNGCFEDCVCTLCGSSA